MTKDNLGNSAKKNIKTVFFMMIFVLAAKLSGLLRNVLITSYMGTSIEGQAFSLASQIPVNFMDTVFAAAISASFIPVFNNYLENKNHKDAFRLANNFITLMMLISFVVCIIGVISAPAIANFHLSSSSESSVESAALMTNLLMILIFTVFTTTTAFSFIGVLQSLGSFYIPSIMSIIPNAVTLIYLFFFFNHFGVYGLALTFVAGNFLQLIIFIRPLKKHGFIFRPALRLSDAGLKQILRLVPMVLIGAWLFPINNMVNNWVLSNHIPEAIVELAAANTLYIVITGFFVLSVANLLFPKLSKESAKNSSEFAIILSQSISIITFFLIPMSIGLWFLREPIVNLVYYRGEFSAENILNSASALGFLAIGMLGFGITTILGRAFFSLMNGKIPMIASIIAIFINFLLSYSLVNHLGITSAAIASTISVSAAGLIMYVTLNKKIKILTLGCLKNYFKITLSAVIMYFVLFIIERIFYNINNIFYITLICLAGIMSYFFCALILNIHEAKIGKKLITAWLRKEK